MSQHFEFSCPFCLRPIQAGPKAVGKSLPCPGCGKTITVPMPENATGEAADDPSSGDEYRLAAPVERVKYTPVIDPSYREVVFDSDLDSDTYRAAGAARPSGDGPSEKLAGEKNEGEDKYPPIERPKLPPHPMTTGIFSMFADPSAITWFIALTFGIAIAIGLLIIPIAIFSGWIPLAGWQEAGIYIVGAVSTGVTAILGMLVFCLAANCLLSILQDSAAGNRIVESWPDKAGGALTIAGMMYVLCPLSYGVGLGLLIAWTLKISWLAVVPPVCFFTFPFFLTSSLETGAPMVPISIPIVRSFFARFTTWLVFYLEAALLGTIALGTTVLLVKSIGLRPLPLSVACALVLGPLFTFLLFLYFRLLGRLVWVCDEWFRSLVPEEDDDEEEEEWEELEIS